jgi:hypothetical protein
METIIGRFLAALNFSSTTGNARAEVTTTRAAKVQNVPGDSSAFQRKSVAPADLMSFQNAGASLDDRTAQMRLAFDTLRHHAVVRKPVLEVLRTATELLQKRR